MGFGSRGGFSPPAPAPAWGIAGAKAPSLDTPIVMVGVHQEKGPALDTPTFTTSVS